MVAAPFQYQRVSSFDEAVRALREHGEEAKVIAGGQSLVPMLNLRVARPDWLIDINPVGAGPIEDLGGYLRLPALTRHRALEQAEVVRRRCPILAAATAFVGNARSRARGTIGGSLAHADPGGELPCVAAALGAEVTVRGGDGARDLAVRDLLVSYLTTALEPDEVITEVRVPTQPERSGWSFLELTRRSSDWMVVGVAALVELDTAGAVAGASVAIGGVADRPWLVPAEPLDELLGAAPEPALLERVAERAAGMLDPEDDVHASGGYRRRMAAVLGRRALAEAVQRARANQEPGP
jgi:aerobic carbon-monoxide dehydrogenase medium subunit